MPNNINPGPMDENQFETFLDFFDTDPLPPEFVDLPDFSPGPSGSVAESAVTPEPASVLLLAIGMAAIGRRNRRSAIRC